MILLFVYIISFSYLGWLLFDFKLWSLLFIHSFLIYFWSSSTSGTAKLSWTWFFQLLNTLRFRFILRN